MIKLTPFEEILYEALRTAPAEGVSYAELAKLKVPAKKEAADPRNKFAVHIMTLRRKLGVRIENIYEFGYRLEQK